MNASLVSRAPRALLAAASLALVAAGCTGEDTQGVHYTFAEAQAIVDGLALEITSPEAGHVFADGATIAVAGGVGVAGAWPDGLSFTVAIRDGATALRTRAVAMNDAVSTFSEVFEGPAPGWYDAALVATLVGEAPDGTLKTARAEVDARFAVNTPPPAPTVVIRATADGASVAPGVGLTAVAEVDDDTIAPGASLQLQYRWFRDDEAAAIRTQVDDPTLPGALVTPGATLRVEVRANDGFREGFDGASAGEASVTVPNAAATCGAMLLAPAAADTTRDITCRCTNFDSPIHGGDRSTCVFRDGDGEVLQDDGSCTLPAEKTEKGMTVTCELTPKDDGGVAGTPISSPAPATVLDAPPSAPEVAITPSAATVEDSVTCEVVTHSVDPDGDSVTYEVRWRLNGELVEGLATASMALASLGAVGGDEVVCEVKALAAGASSAFAVSAPLTLDNAAPQLPNVLLTSAPGSPPTVEDTLTCDVSQATDPDGEELTVTFEWFIDDDLIEGADGATLSGDAFARGDVVRCRATACDPHEACTAAINSKTSALIQNALPTIGAVLITGARAGGVGEPGDTLTCEFSGWHDADGDDAEVSYTWSVTDPDTGATTVIVGQTSEDYTVSEALAEGAIVTCTVTPKNGADEGEPRTADAGVTVVAPSPIAPVVAVVAPDGADGEVTCGVVEEAQNLPAGVTWTWRWSLSGAASFTAGATLAADEVSHCDLVKCWAELSGPGDLALTSNEAVLQMAAGGDCDDGNPCTDALCLAGGGCNLVPVDGGPCDDGDPCTGNEVCMAGQCVGTQDICTEDRLSVTTYGGTSPVVPAATAGGGYHVGIGSDMRSTDARDSRLDEQRTASGAYLGAAVSPTGRVAMFRYHSTSSNIQCSAQYGYYLRGYYTTRVYEADLETFTDLPAEVWRTCHITAPSYARTLAFSDEGFVNLIKRGSTIYAQLIDASLNRSDTFAVIGDARASSAANHREPWDATIVPDGTDAFIVAWVSSDRKTVYAQRHSRNGATEFADAITVATTTGTFDTAAVAAMPNGRFVVAWQGSDVDGFGLGVAAQRLDDAGNKLGAPFVVNEVATGDQLLGSVAAFSNLRFVVAWRDGSTPTARYIARTFNTAAAGDPQFVLNEATTASALVPSVAALEGDDWIAVWKDSANVLWTRRYRPDGSYAQGAAEFRANDEAAGDQETPAAAATLGGRTLVAFASRVFPSGNFASEIVARVFDVDGREVGAERIVNDDHMLYAQTSPAVAAGADRFVVAWDSEEQDGEANGIYARVLDDDGAPLGDTSLLVNVTTAGYQRQPAVAMAADGTWAAAWNGQSSVTGSSSDVFLRVFGPNGEATDEVVVNSTLANVQERPTVAVVPFASDLVVAWQSRSQDGDGLGIFVRKFGFDGAPKTVEFPVNATTTGDQRNPTVAVSQTNQVAVCWESVGQVVSGKPAIACQFLRTSDLLPVGGELVPFSWTDDQSAPHVRFQADGRLAIAWQTLSLDSDGYAVQLVRVTNQGAAVGERITANRHWAGNQVRPFLVPHDDRLVVGWESDGQDASGKGIYFRMLPLSSP